ncbi:MAG TPA: M20/M25/M40 family metallo-hydrolase [Steroidobacteraceae bacterium]|nr:M20/M25/M40 family metallo-hydrolase [Steroidobacteraceae bacterium]
MKNYTLLHAIALLSLTLATGTAAAAERPAPLPPEADRELARDILKELIATNTTHEHGSTVVAQIIRQQLLAAGYPAGDVQFLAPTDKPTKGNVVVRIHGKGHGPAVLFIGHLDVVEAHREDWSTDPFELVEQDGWFYGRGTLDMKGGDAALMESLIRLKREKFTPAHDLIFAFTADEEAGGDANGPAFLLKEHRDVIEAGTVLNLDGGGGALVHGERKFLRLGTSEKVYATFSAETTSPGGHGSLPGPDNAIYRLADGLGRLETYRFPVMTTATTRASFQQRAALTSGNERDDLLAVASESPDPEAAKRLSNSSVGDNAQLRTTCVATLISGGHAENALPQRARATIQCRLMPTDTVESVQAQLTAAMNDPKIALTLDAPPVLSPESPPTKEILVKVGRVAHSMWPGVPIIPTMATGFSDGRQTRSAGMPTYDVSGLWEDVEDNRAHGRDERIGVQAYYESVEYTYRLIKAFGAR